MRMGFDSRFGGFEAAGSTIWFRFWGLSVRHGCIRESGAIMLD